MPHEEVTAPSARETAVVAVYDDHDQAERANRRAVSLRFRRRPDRPGGLRQRRTGRCHRRAEARRAVGGGRRGGGRRSRGRAGCRGGPRARSCPRRRLLLGLLEGAAAGGLLGLLIALGVPEARARASVQAVELGRTVVVVRAEGERLEDASGRLQAYGPYELELTEHQTAPTCD